MSDRALVRNAADPKQVRFAEQVERRRAERFENALRAVLRTPDGRVVMGELIHDAGVYRSPWSPSAEIHYRVGQQDYGRKILALVLAADEEMYQLMQREEWAWSKAQDRSIDASHTARARTEESGNGRDDERPG